MKKIIILSLLPLVCSSCLTHIVTVAPTPVKTTAVVTSPAVVVHNPTPIYTTTITTPKVRTVSTATVTAISQDISLYLDLQAVGAAFAQSNSVQDFEQLLNNSSYMLSNLDLNGDGYIDYLRVLETVKGYTHVFLIQAVLGANIYQDVATLVAEIPQITRAFVQIIGDPFIYGPNYIVQPAYVVTPYIYNRLMVINYQPWTSPWYWNHYPACYRRPAPIVINHYQAYIATYMSNHHYCNMVTYPTQCHYPDYAIVTQAQRRNDYGAQHPEQDFVRRSGSSRANASTVRAQQAASVTTTTTSRSASATRSTATSSPAKSTSTPTRSTSTAQSRTTVTSKVRTNGSATTKTTTTTTTPTRATSTSTSSRASSPTPTTSRATSATPTASRATSTTPTRSSTTTSTPSRSTSSSTTRR